MEPHHQRGASGIIDGRYGSDVAWRQKVDRQYPGPVISRWPGRQTFGCGLRRQLPGYRQRIDTVKRSNVFVDRDGCAVRYQVDEGRIQAFFFDDRPAQIMFPRSLRDAFRRRTRSCFALSGRCLHGNGGTRCPCAFAGAGGGMGDGLTRTNSNVRQFHVKPDDDPIQLDRWFGRRCATPASPQSQGGRGPGSPSTARTRRRATASSPANRSTSSGRAGPNADAPKKRERPPLSEEQT